MKGTDDMNPLVLNERLKAHGRRIELLEQDQKVLASALQSIQRTLTQLKWLGVGAALMFVANEFGLAELIKMKF